MKITGGVLPLLIGSYARKYGVELLMYGHTAYTNGSQITIPRLDLADPEAMNLAYGYVGHECGHIMFTDFDVAASKGIASGSTLFALLNAMEDARIERLQVWSWPGMERTFDGVLKSLRKDLFEAIRAARQAQDLATMLTLYCNSRAHEDWTTSPSLRGMRRFVQVALRSLLPAAAVKTVDHLISRVAYKATTAEVLEVAEAVYKFIQKFVRRNNDELDKQQQPQEQQANSESSQEPDLFAGQPRPEQPRKKPNLSRMMKEFNLTPEQVRALEEDFSPVQRLKISSKCGELPTAAAAMERCSYATGCAQDFGGVATGEARPGDKGELYRKVVGGNFRVQVADLMRSYDEWLNGTRDSGRELDIRAYANRKINNFHVFKARKLRQCVNTSVELLVDASGSMASAAAISDEGKAPRRYEVANECALALAMGMEGIRNLSRDVIYFPGSFAEFDDICSKEQTVRNRAPFFAQQPHSCTPLTQALLHAVERLPEKSPFQRNIIIVVTDGKPDCFETAQKVIERCTELGVEIYGIGIGEGAQVANLPYLATETVLNATELPAAMKRLIRRTFFRKNVCGNSSLAATMAARMSHL